MSKEYTIEMRMAEEQARQALEELGSLREQYAAGKISVVEYMDRFVAQKNLAIYWIEAIQINTFQAR